MKKSLKSIVRDKSGFTILLNTAFAFTLVSMVRDKSGFTILLNTVLCLFDFSFVRDKSGFTILLNRHQSRFSRKELEINLVSQYS